MLNIIFTKFENTASLFFTGAIAILIKLEIMFSARL
jgi:hypothetical protein